MSTLGAFCRSPLGQFIQSPLGARGCEGSTDYVYMLYHTDRTVAGSLRLIKIALSNGAIQWDVAVPASAYSVGALSGVTAAMLDFNPHGLFIADGPIISRIDTTDGAVYDTTTFAFGSNGAFCGNADHLFIAQPNQVLRIDPSTLAVIETVSTSGYSSTGDGKVWPLVVNAMGDVISAMYKMDKDDLTVFSGHSYPYNSGGMVVAGTLIGSFMVREQFAYEYTSVCRDRTVSTSGGAVAHTIGHVTRQTCLYGSSFFLIYQSGDIIFVDMNIAPPATFCSASPAWSLLSPGSIFSTGLAPNYLRAGGGGVVGAGTDSSGGLGIGKLQNVIPKATSSTAAADEAWSLSVPSATSQYHLADITVGVPGSGKHLASVIAPLFA